MIFVHAMGLIVNTLYLSLYWYYSNKKVNSKYQIHIDGMKYLITEIFLYCVEGRIDITTEDCINEYNSSNLLFYRI